MAWAPGSRSFARAELVRGAAWVLERVGFDAALATADLVITGEGVFDRTSLRRKGTGRSGAARPGARRRKWRWWRAGLNDLTGCTRSRGDPEARTLDVGELSPIAPSVAPVRLFRYTSGSYAPTADKTMDKLVSLCKRRGFVFQSSEIYGGLGSVWDYGPLGVELKNNIKERWWRSMVHERDDIEGLDAAILMHPRVWEASGHVAGFTDPLVDCKQCKNRFRADDPQHQGHARRSPTRSARCAAPRARSRRRACSI